MNIALYRKNIKYLMSKRGYSYNKLVEESLRVSAYHCLAKDLQGFVEKGEGNATMRKLESLARVFGESTSRLLETDIEMQDKLAF